jgi:hypothetical protein
MCAYLDDWLIWSFQPNQVHLILTAIRNLGFTINEEKSMTQPSTQLTYLGLEIDTTARTITPTTACLRHLRQLMAIVPAASRQDLRRIAGYVASSSLHLTSDTATHTGCEYYKTITSSISPGA